MSVSSQIAPTSDLMSLQVRHDEATSVVQQPTCRLLELPLEIRAEIYRQLFKAAHLSIEPVYPSSSHCRFAICSCQFPWQVINTCHQLRQEALKYLLASTTLQIAGIPSKAQLLPSILLSGISRVVVLNVEAYSKQPLDLRMLPSLRTLELRNIAVWCQYHDEEYFSDEAGDEVMLDLAMFNLKRNSPHLHQLCSKHDRQFNILLYCRYVVSSVKQQTLDAVIDVDNQVVLHKKMGGSMTSRNAWAGFY